MTRLSRLARTALHAAQHPVNVVALASGLVSAVAWDNPLPLAFYALTYCVGTVALWNWGVFGDRFAAENAATASEAAARHRASLAAELARSLERFRLHGYQKVRPLLEEYAQLSRIRAEVARLAHERGEVNLTSETEILRRVDEMLAAYLELATKHVVYLRLLTGLHATAVVPRVAVRVLPRLADRLSEIDQRRDALAQEVADQPADSPTREALQNQLKALDERTLVFEEAGRNHESVLSQLDAIRAVFAALAERMAAAELVAADVSGYLETAAAEIEHARTRVAA
jgi:hypothetical protein